MAHIAHLCGGARIFISTAYYTTAQFTSANVPSTIAPTHALLRIATALTSYVS